MNWNNIDLTKPYEREQNIIDPLSSETLLLEISCNIPNINRETVIAQFEYDLETRITSAREIFNNNLDNIVNQAQKERNED